MTWTTYHNRGNVLRDVAAVAEERGDGLLPMDVSGVREKFDDELDLLGALQIKWHTRLAGWIERELFEEPRDLESAVIRAWHHTTHELTGVRRVLDHYLESPTSAEMAEMLLAAQVKEHAFLTLMAGQGNYLGEQSAAVGSRIEARARRTYVAPVEVVEERVSLLDRVRSLVA